MTSNGASIRGSIKADGGDSVFGDFDIYSDEDFESDVEGRPARTGNRGEDGIGSGDRLVGSAVGNTAQKRRATVKIRVGYSPSIDVGSVGASGF